MPITDDRTPNLGLKLPYADNMLEDDSQRLRDALTAIDTAVAAKASAASVSALTTTVSTKADLVGGKVPASQLPSSVDDVREFDNYAALPTVGESGTIYVLLTPYTIGGYTASQFRWTGSSYQPIVSSPGSTDAVPEGVSNLYHTNARALAAVPIATPTTLGKVKIGAGLGIDAEGLLYAAAGGGSVMSLQEITPASNGVSSITVPGGYTVGTIIVAFNGSFLGPNDFTATDGTTIGLVGFTAGVTDRFTVVNLATVVIGTLPVGSVGATQLAPSAVITSKVDDQAITLPKISASVYGTSGANKLLQLDGAGRLPALDGSQLTGIATPLASSVETQAGSLTNKAVTPAGLAASVLGIGQTLQDVTAIRSLGTTYYNTTGRPISIAVSALANGVGGYFSALCNGMSMGIQGTASLASGASYATLCFVVPPGASYSVTNNSGMVLQTWTEYR